MSDKLQPIHPGEILKEEFLVPMKITNDNLAKNINISTNVINEIIAQNRSINTELGLRLSKYFGMSEKFWLNLQLKYDLEITKDKLEDKLDLEIQPRN